MTLIEKMLSYRKKQKGFPAGNVDFLIGESERIPLAKIEEELIIRIHAPLRDKGFDVLLQPWSDAWQVHVYNAETGKYFGTALAMNLDSVVPSVLELIKEKRARN